MKMADVDIDPFGEHDKPNKGTNPDKGETIPIDLGGVTETSFREKSQKTRLMESQVKSLYKRLYEVMGQDPRAIHFNCSNSKVITCTSKTRGTTNA